MIKKTYYDFPTRVKTFVQTNTKIKTTLKTTIKKVKKQFTTDTNKRK